MKPVHVAPLFALLIACGSKPSYSVGGHSLTVADSGYVTAPYFCQGAAQGQLKLNIVDYDPICGGMVPAGAPGGARDPQLEHNEIELIFVLSAHDNQSPKVPYDVSPPNCDVGPAGPGIAYFKHYQSNSTTPEIKVAQSGELYLTSYDMTDKMPAVGSFQLDFGGGDKIQGDFETYTCN